MLFCPESIQTGKSRGRRTLDNEATDEFQAALNCLELTWPCTESDVITAHRRLIQKHHPDHGGSHERAAALNSAKTLLIETIRGQEGSSS